jgi:hypothetical protein
MSQLVYDIRQTLAEFPGDWQEEGVGNVLTFPGGILRVGPQGFSGSTGGGFLSIVVYIVLDKDRIPDCASAPIAFHRALHNNGSITPPRPRWQRAQTELRQSIHEALEFIGEQEPPAAEPLKPQPSVFDILFGYD